MFDERPSDLSPEKALIRGKLVGGVHGGVIAQFLKHRGFTDEGSSLSNLKITDEAAKFQAGFAPPQPSNWPAYALVTGLIAAPFAIYLLHRYLSKRRQQAEAEKILKAIKLREAVEKSTEQPTTGQRPDDQELLIVEQNADKELDKMIKKYLPAEAVKTAAEESQDQKDDENDKKLRSCLLDMQRLDAIIDYYEQQMPGHLPTVALPSLGRLVGSSLGSFGLGRWVSFMGGVAGMLGKDLWHSSVLETLNWAYKVRQRVVEEVLKELRKRKKLSREQFARILGLLKQSEAKSKSDSDEDARREKLIKLLEEYNLARMSQRLGLASKMVQTIPLLLPPYFTDPVTELVSMPIRLLAYGLGHLAYKGVTGLLVRRKQKQLEDEIKKFLADENKL
jgi:transcriptional regulator with XRE-family HTH domain